MTELNEILLLVENFINNKQKNWRPGIDYVRYAGDYFDSSEYVTAVKTLLSGWLVMGEDSLRFEKQFPPHLGKSLGILTNSGSSSNLLMMSALTSKQSYNFPKGTKVLIPIAGFPTTLNPILQVGFEPIFVDIELETLNLNLNKLEDIIKSNNIKIITFAHVLGNPPNMNYIMELVKKYNLILLEDCCDALGSLYDGKKLGSFGLMSSCSFYPAHHLSCSWDTPIPYINENNIVYIENIETIFEKYRNTPENIKIISFNKDNNIEWKSPSHILKHPLGNKKMFRITSEHGRFVDVTEDHSVFILDDALNIIAIEAKNIKENDYLVSAGKLPFLSENYQSIDLIQWSIKNNYDMYISGFPNRWLNNVIDQDDRYNYKIRNSLPIKYIGDYSEDELKVMKIGIAYSSTKIPCQFIVNENIGRLLGYYIAEGSYGNKNLNISLHKNEFDIIEDINFICKEEFGLEVFKYDSKQSNGINLCINSYTLQLIFKNLFNINDNSHNKRIPNILFSSNENVIKSFVYGYTKGDGSIRKTDHITIDVTSVSKSLLNDFQYLLSFIGISSSYYRRNKQGLTNISGKQSYRNENYTLRFSGFEYDNILKTIRFINTKHRNMVVDQIPKNEKILELIKGEPISKNTKVLSRKRIINILNKKGNPIPEIIKSNLMFLKVRKIEELNYEKEDVYDFSVPENENFYGGFLGLFLHNTMGEGGFVACNDKSLQDVLRSFREWGRACFKSGTPINVLESIKKIENVKVGDVVLTHLGNNKLVTELFARNYTGNYYTFTSRLKGKISSTEEHPHYIFSKQNNKIEWKLSKDIQIGDCFLEKIPEEVKSNYSFNWSYDTLYKTVHENIDASPDLMRLIGYWLAEGSLTKGLKGKSGYSSNKYFYYRVEFAFHKKEIEYIQDVENLMNKFFGVKGLVRKIHNSNAVSLTFKSRKAYEFFIQHFGKLAQNKKLPENMVNWNNELTSELVKGFWCGDGSYNERNSSFIIDSTSYILIEQIRRILLKYNIISSYSYTPKEKRQNVSTINGKFISAKNGIHSIRQYGINGELFSFNILKSQIKSKTNKRFARIQDGYVYYPISKIQIEEYDGIVYNIEVEDDHSYHAFGVATHNCYCSGPKANTLKNGTCKKRFNNWIPAFPNEIFDHKYVYDEIGYNLKPIELQASIGLQQLKKLDEIVSLRKRNYNLLYDVYKKYEEYFILPRATELSDPSWFAFPLTIKSTSPFSRNKLVDFLESKKIQTRPYFAGNIMLQPAYNHLMNQETAIKDYPNATYSMLNTFFHGVSPVITTEQINYIQECVTEFMNNYE